MSEEMTLETLRVEAGKVAGAVGVLHGITCHGAPVWWIYSDKFNVTGDTAAEALEKWRVIWK